MRASLASALIERAGNLCECGCGLPFDTSLKGTRTFDHFAGRGRVEDCLEEIWVLRWGHHKAKTDLEPDAPSWLKRFATHCRRYGYAKQLERTEARLDFVVQRSDFNSKGAANG